MTNFKVFLFVSLLAVGCSSQEKKEKEAPKKVVAEKKVVTPNPKKEVPTPKKVAKRPSSKKYIIRPGEVIRVEFSLEKSLVKKSEEDLKLTCGGRKVPFIKKSNKVMGIVAESYFSRKEPYQCSLLTKDKKTVSKAKIQVVDKKFPFEKLNVDKRRIVYSKKDLKRILKEQAKLNKIYANSSNVPYFERSFMIPLSSKVTSIYGSRRLYNKNKRSQHLGTDFRAKVGKPIRSSNGGKVVLAQDLFFTGKTVIIDHGLGIFTLYGHLSKLHTTLGEYVPQNALLGLAGATGRVTGPHLHWGVKVQGHWIEGASLVQATQTEDFL